MTSWLIDGQMPWGSVDFGPLVEKAHLMYRASDYAQAAPGVLKGDLYFYSVEHDMRESVSLIDTTKVPLYLLTGEYDYLSTPAQSEATAAKIKGASMTTMQEIGHFPISEDHDRVHALPPSDPGRDSRLDRQPMRPGGAMSKHVPYTGMTGGAWFLPHHSWSRTPG